MDTKYRCFDPQIGHWDGPAYLSIREAPKYRAATGRHWLDVLPYVKGLS